MPTLPAATATTHHHAAAAATAAAGNGYAVLFAIGALWAVCYVIACAIWPFKPCTRCDGRGKFPSPSGRAWRYCRHCDDGAKLRAGRRVYNHLRGHHNH
ncbi:MAG TPA: hypothetical protein VFU43_29380 [Streptosporangiaceae bacterium]|nr:hypothetical protein [Streptosporangiaceae bacterium]